LVIPGQDAPNDIFIDGNAERPGNLLSDSRAAPGGIALLGGDNRIPEFFGRAPGTGLEPALRGEEQAVLALGKDLVKVQKGRRLQNDGRTEQPGRPHKESAPTGDDAIGKAEIRSALARAMEDQQLMFNQDGLGNYGTEAARPRQSGDSRVEVDEKDHEIAHFRMVARKLKLTEFRAN
jgi:hypothetical protein